MLENLPPSLPTMPLGQSAYRFSLFEVDAKFTNENGKGPAVNHALEVWLGSCINGLKLQERGPEIVAVVKVIECIRKTLN